MDKIAEKIGNPFKAYGKSKDSTFHERTLDARFRLNTGQRRLNSYIEEARNQSTSILKNFEKIQISIKSLNHHLSQSIVLSNSIGQCLSSIGDSYTILQGYDTYKEQNPQIDKIFQKMKKIIFNWGNLLSHQQHQIDKVLLPYIETSSKNEEQFAQNSKHRNSIFENFSLEISKFSKETNPEKYKKEKVYTLSPYRLDTKLEGSSGYGK